MGALAGLVSVVPEAGRLWSLIPMVAVLLMFELAGRPLRLVQNRRLVPQEVIPRSRFEGPFQFGFEMGTGVRTFTPTALPHALVLTIILMGGIGPGVLAGLGFGLGRVLMPLTRSLSGDPQGWDHHLLRWLAWVGRLCAAGFLLALLVLLDGWT
ncbi:hypothetical protein Acor_15860 [Acrocarpospora corrugata]|uniref:Uncharacterized protein n=1 Tax=Acrocarpospora corrugata TaxID=35763 RepID=A0A5M3VWQ0_9ACTN|nr:hypothetical protein [Acrocarpospora corrugata]GER99522.1 hypothetical protein Acor_15860 [Acrocarpospora corrugata]